MKLTSRELAVMKILWEADEPLMISEIVQREKNSTIYSVQRIMQNLLRKNAVTIDGIGYNKKALARKFSPIITSESVELGMIREMFGNMSSKNIPAANLIAALLPQENDEKTLAELEELEKIIARRKQQILDGNDKDKPTED